MKRLAAIATILAVMSAAARPVWAEDGKNEDGPKQEIRKVAEELATAFNKGDAESVANLWIPDGDFVGPRGDWLKGREEIQKSFAKFFSVNPEVRLKITVTSIRTLDSNTAILDVIPEVTPPLQGPPVKARTTFVLARRDQRWLIVSGRDMMIHTPSNYEQLKELEWMIGDWVDGMPESEGVSVQSTCEWTTNKNFILRRFSVVLKGRITKNGSQLIGWDPRKDEIHSWVFDTAGDLQEGSWRRHGHRWIVTVSGVRRDGDEIAATNILTRVDDDTFTFESRDRSINGQPDPDIGEITIRRARSAEDLGPDRPKGLEPAGETILPD